MVKQLVRAIFCITLLAFMGVAASAQSTGEIKGTVTDTNGAVVPGATVEVTNDSTGEKKQVVAGDEGNYTVTKLIPGSYTVVATQTNFAAATFKQVNVSVSFSSTVDLVLNPAGTDATVIISTGDSATQLNTTDQQLSTIIDNKKILELPLLGRDPNALILLAPGATQTNSGLGGFSVNGQRERNNNFLVDGVDNNDTDVPGIPGGLATPNIDATQEFRVITGNFNAEFGRNTGATILIATKNGTNQFHGGAYIYYRSDAFSARDFFDVSGKPDPLQRKQYGVSIGGPIKRDKAFFFFNYEGDRFTQGSQETRVVPSASARMGILNTGAVTAANGADGHFGVLDIRPAGANNAFGLPFNAAMLALTNSIYPLGNSGDGPIPGAFDNYKFGFNFVQKVDSIASRVDYQLNNKHTLVTSYGYNNGRYPLFADTFAGSGDGGNSPQQSHVLSVNLVSSFSPNLINEVRFGYNRLYAAFNGVGDGTASTQLDDKVRAAFTAAALPVPPNLGSRNGQVLNLVGGGISGLGTFDTQFRTSGTTTIGDSFTWITGNHTMKFGGEYRTIFSNGPTNFGRSEVIDFGFPTGNGVSLVNFRNFQNQIRDVPLTGVGATINNYLSWLAGFVNGVSQSQYFDKAGVRRASDDRQFRVREYDFFFQDNWRVKSNFTLNYGLRYENKGVPWEVHGLLSNLVQDPSFGNPSAQGFEFITVGKGSTNPSIGLYELDRNNFAPRFGFNYSPDFKTGWISKLTGGPGKTSIRGGYGVFYDRVFGNLFSNARGNPPFQQDFLDFPADPDLNNLGLPPTQISSRFVFGARGDQNGPLLFPVIFPRAGNNQFQTKFATPYTQSWNFGFQRELGNAFLLEADYVANHAVNLLRVIDGNMTNIARVNAILHLNPADPTRAITTSLTTNFFRGSMNTAFFQSALQLATGQSTYNSLQARMTKTLTNEKFGLGQLQVAYSWSHAIDNASDPLVTPTGIGERSFPRDSSGYAGGFDSPERGTSGFDVRHRVVFNFIYELPFHYTSTMAKYLLNDWTISGIEQVQSGSPFSVFINGVDTQGTALSARAYYATAGNALPLGNAALANPRAYTAPVLRTQFVGPACTTTVLTNCVRLNGQQGNVPRNLYVGPAFTKFDFSIIKRIPITESKRFSIRADFFNMFNRVNFGTPIVNALDQRFGQSTTTRGQPRIIQFVGRFEF
ncbi:MAG: carboxypeptidase regulatory-like domain-containing protein [Pyrinomonadaceae bacterium]